MDDRNKITYFAETDARNKRVKFGIKAEDRLRHIYSIGKTGMGKSTLLENMAIQDIQSGEGMAFLDPHGKTADLLLDYVPEHRIKDVIYFAPFDTEYPISFNVMEDVGPDRRHLVISGLMSAFEKIWADAWSARMAYILQNTLAALLEYPGATLLGVNRMYSDKAFRTKVVENIKDPTIKAFWTEEYAKYTDKYTQEATPAIQNKIGQFASNPLVRNIIGQPTSSFDLRKIMDEKKILIVNLSKGLVGEGNANLLGSMLVTKMYLAAMSRADADPQTLKRLPNFYLYVDEFQSFANKSFADILSEARKYKLSLNITHQYVEQMEEEVRAAVFGNVGTMICFRVGSYDAEILEKEFAPVFTMEDLVNLGKFQIYLKLMIDQVASQPFSAIGMAPIKAPDQSFREAVLNASREIYSRPRAEVEQMIKDWHAEQKEVVSSPDFAKATTGKQQSVVREYKTEQKPAVPRKDEVKIMPQKIEPKVVPHVQRPEPRREEPKREPPKETVSLQELKTHDKPKPKVGSAGNISALREAIAKAKEQGLAKGEAPNLPKKTGPEPVKPPVRQEVKQEAAKEKKEEISGSKKEDNKREIPEAVLRQMLKGDGD